MSEKSLFARTNRNLQPKIHRSATTYSVQNSISDTLREMTLVEKRSLAFNSDWTTIPNRLCDCARPRNVGNVGLSLGRLATFSQSTSPVWPQISVMSRRGNPYDNARAGRFMRTLKEEEVYGRDYRDLEDARRRIGEFLEQAYNRQRLHSALRYLTPEEFERESEARGSDGPRFAD